MTRTVISVTNLGKEYIIGAREPGQENFREMVVSAAAAPFRRLKRLSGSAALQQRIWALKDVSFEVKEGEVVGIIGRNGAGKSTLLKILSRITAPTAGRIELRGRVSSLLEVGTGFHPELTGRENVYLNGAILGMSRVEIDRKFDEIVDFAGIETFLDTPVKRYSSGMSVRLAFAIAAHLEPEIMIVDEVLAVGDAEFQRKCLGKMGEVARGGRTVIIVSHQLGVLREVCGRGFVLSGGRAQSFNTIDAAVRHYLRGQEQTSEGRFGKHIREIYCGGEAAGRGYLFFGEELVLRVRLKDIHYPRSGLRIAIKDAYGRRLSLFSTEPHDGISLPPGGDLEIALIVAFCGYAPGKYFADVALTEPRVKVLEEITNGTEFEVLPAPRGGSLPYGNIDGEFFPPHRWSMNVVDRRVMSLEAK